jgi:hypothetical protein
MWEIHENLVEPETVTTRNCYNCANYSVCTIRVDIPKYSVKELESQKPYKWPDKVIPPMPCGGAAWETIDSSDTRQLTKLPNETWKAFMARKKAVNPQLTELPG